MASKFSNADYLAGLQRLMPRGRVWPRAADAVQTKVLAGTAPTFQRIDESAIQLAQDANPSTTVNLLDEWEATLGLPDPCVGAAPTMDQRQAAVRARFNAVGDDTRAFFIEYAANLGYTITIKNQAASRIGRARVGDVINNDSINFVLFIHCATLDDILQCELNAVCPAWCFLVYENP